MKSNIKFLNEVAKFSKTSSKSNDMFSSDQMKVDILTMKAGQYFSPTQSYLADSYYYVLEGEAIFEIDDDVSILVPNASLFVGPGQSVGIINESDENLIILKVQAPPEGI
jgi:mannose-6-phosphate isomerase-like protein (cupin superfamily)